MQATLVKTKHVYERDPHRFEDDVNEALIRIEEEGGIIDEILYSIDPATDNSRRGGFGALIVYEIKAS
jgi:hypothetical protein